MSQEYRLRLQKLGLTFERKGGTSLSKGYQIINRFSEDIDLRIEPPKDRDVKTGRNQNNPAKVRSREEFYGWLAKAIRIDGIEKVEPCLTLRVGYGIEQSLW